MKKQTTIILAILIFITCLSAGVKLEKPYNNLETNNLKGKVKEVKTFERIHFFYEDQPTVLKKYECYDSIGNLIVKNTYDFDGNMNDSALFYYDENNVLSSSTVQSYFFLKGKIENEYRFNSFDKPDFTKLTMDDTIIIETYYHYDKYGNLNKMVMTDGGEGSFTQWYKNTLDSEGRVIKSDLRREGDPHRIRFNISTYQYDIEGRLIKFTNQASYSEDTKTIITYSPEGFLETRSMYNGGQLSEVTTYDKEGKEMYEKDYEASKLVSETKTEYEYDQQGNWISKKHYMRVLEGHNEWDLHTEYTREIVYY